MSPITRILVIASIVIALTDIAVYIRIKAHPERLTIPGLIGVIIITIVPIVINVWYHVGR